ncbi:MAG: hypothetical protein U0133_10965 [Gemmatimonadales bacterium]
MQHSAEQDPSYVVENKGGSYASSFTALKDSVVYRPPMVTPGPRCQGSRPAKVVDESDPGDREEIWPDKYGRCAAASPGTATATIPAGCGWPSSAPTSLRGFVWIPRVGDEVVISYVEAIPTSRSSSARSSADNPVPYLLPDNKTQHGIKTMSSPGGGSENYNEFFIEDKKGSS